MRRTLCILSLVGFAPAFSLAQHPGAPMPAAAVSGAHFAPMPAPMAAPRAAVPAHPVSAASVKPVARVGRTSTRLSPLPKSTTHPTGWNQTANSGVNTYPGRGFSNCNSYPVPGLGFDYTHYFAVHPNAGNGCQGFGRGYGYFVGGGAYFPIPAYMDQSAAAQPAPEEAAPAEPAAQQGDESSPQDAYNTAPRMSPQPAPKPQAEYVFVRRDGTLIFAVAYSWINDRLQYVTSEGLRRTITIDTIDLGATQQFNEQRGIPIQLPA